ncbi:MAG: 3-methyl-2-oxobutanoate hydroxymethyltransferase [Myxococcaceae bacterium]|nr:3-methyl-2-oxobutanoate hydroxymethyltransferase [Myxococcaceae bacterium]
MYYGGYNGAVGATPRKITVPEIRARKTVGPQADLKAARISMITAYDFTMARLVDAAGIDMVLVGDSLGMVVQGLSNTIPVTLDEICYHGRAVARGLQRAHLVGDLPFMSYQVSSAQAVESAGKIMKDGAFESVKLEGGLELADHVFRIVRAGIPVVGHIGLTPQSVHALGGFKVQGRGDEAAEKLLADARALEQAGVFAIVLEAIPPDLAARVSREVSVPTIGIGAGAACDGQVLVCTDLLGLVQGKIPKFAKRYAELGDAVVGAVEAYIREVQDGSFPGPEHTYKPNGPAANGTSATVGPEGNGHDTSDLDAPLALDLWH